LDDFSVDRDRLNRFGSDFDDGGDVLVGVFGVEGDAFAE